MIEPGSSRRKSKPEPSSHRFATDPVADRNPGLRIEPARIRRGRSAVSAGVVFVISVTFIAVAVMKPWAWSEPAVATATHPIPPGRPTAATPPSPGPIASGHPVPTADLVAASSLRDAWGIRAVVATGDEPLGGSRVGNRTGLNLEERWIGLDGRPVSGATSRVSPAAPGDRVVALGVTTPNDEMPLDVRFWRLEPGGAARRVVPVPVSGPEAGSWLWLADPAEALDRTTWPSGTYRIDVLLGSTIVRLETTIPAGGPGLVPEVPEVSETANLVTMLETYPPGPFAVTPHDLIAVDVMPHPAIDERVAWLGPASGRTDIASIGQVAADPVSGLGVLFSPGEQFLTAKLELVGPGVAQPVVDTVALPPVSRPDSTIETGILMERTDPKPFDTGLYHLSVVTGLSTGDRIRNWNLEIVPSRPPPPPGAPLVWMRIWIPIAGDVNHLADEPIVSDRDLGPNNGDGTCGGSAHIGPGDTVVGLVEPGEIRVVRVRLTPLGGASPADVPVRYAPNAATGLTVIALPSGGLATGSYRMTVDTSAAAGTDGRRVYTMCVT